MGQELSTKVKSLLSAQSQSALDDFNRLISKDPTLVKLFGTETFNGSQLAFGVYYLYLERQKNPVKVLLPKTSEFNPQKHKDLLKISRIYAHMSLSAYMDTNAKLEEELSRDIYKEFDWHVMSSQLDHGTAQESYCAHYLVVSKIKKKAVLVIRGTASYRDILTDLIMTPTSLSIPGMEEHGKYHGGIADAVSKLYKKLALTIEILTAAGYSIDIIGHSLGAGSAAILAYAFRKTKVSKNVHAYCFASPSVASVSAVKEMREFVTCFVNGHDAISRISPRSSLILMKEMIALDWDKIYSEIQYNGLIGDLTKNHMAELDKLRARFSSTKISYPELANFWLKEKMKIFEDLDQEGSTLQLPGKIVAIYDDAAYDDLTFKIKSPFAKEEKRPVVPKAALVNPGEMLQIEVSTKAGTDHSMDGYISILDELAK